MTSFSTVVGGGVHGKVVGIAHGTIAQVGLTIEAFHLFIHEYPQVGGMITGIVVGKGIPGTSNQYLTINFSNTGAAGKRTGIGKSNKHGVSRV